MSFVKVWSKRHSLRLGENWSFGPLQFEHIFNVKFPNQFIGYKDGFGTGFLDNEMLQQCYTKVIAEIYRMGFEEYFEKRALPVFESFLDFSKTIPVKMQKQLSSQEIFNIWKDFINREDEWMNYVWMVFLLDDGLTKEIKKKLEEIQFSEIERLLPAMVAPEKKTAAYKLKKELLRLAALLEAGEVIDRDLEEITRTYGYFSILNMDESPLEIDYFRNEVEKLVSMNPSHALKSMEEDEAGIEDLYREVREKLALHPDILRLVEACKKVAYYREYRNDLRQETYYYARHLYAEIAERSVLSSGDLIFATRKEIEEFLSDNKKINKDFLLQRKTLSAVISDYNIGLVSYEFDSEKVIELWPEEDVATDVKEFRGITAFAGKVTGTAKVIFDVTKQADDFEEGDILIATTTNLSFIPLMSKAAAIVTDEGGLLTHTAIIARELKKVAIVGCKVATKILKDGDSLEVDANVGIVKVLS